MPCPIPFLLHKYCYLKTRQKNQMSVSNALLYIFSLKTVIKSLKMRMSE